jgi:hypothetical protein
MWISGIEYKELIWMCFAIGVGLVYGIMALTYGKKRKNEDHQ